VADKLLLVDDSTGRFKRGGTPFSAPVDEDFDIGIGGADEVQLVTPISPTNKIDVYVNGKLLREGASFDFVRNHDDEKIEFNYTIPQNAWVRVRIY
jgi:hypothetical protein